MKISLSQLELNFQESIETDHPEKSVIEKIKDWVRKFWEVVEL